MDINLHIERLVLDGVGIGCGQGDLLQASVTNELTRLFNRGGLVSIFVGGAALSGVATNSIQMSDGKPKHLVNELLNLCYGGIDRE